MKGTKFIGVCLVVVLALFVVVPVASAQQNPSIAGILDGQWFKVKASMKGYMLDPGTKAVLQKSSGGATDYIRFSYSAGAYSILTCAQDDQNPGLWHKTTAVVPPGPPDPRNYISIDGLYGEVYPQIWDFDGIPIVFYDGYSTYSLYPTLYMKITAAGSVLTKATISTLTCGIWADIEDLGESFNGIGSCGLSGSLIPEAQVATKVPEQCRQ